MLDIVGKIVVWAFVGALPGFYVALLRGYRPWYGIGVGALLGVMIAEVAMPLGIVSTYGSAVVILLGLGVIAGLLLPRSSYMDENASMQMRTNYLAYALVLPTASIVIGIVIFPLIWNLIFSVRPIRTADLQNITVLDLSDFTLENYESQVGLRLDTVPCATDDTGECIRDADGGIEYQSARRYYDDYRGWRESNAFDLGGKHYVIGVRDREFYPIITRTLFYSFASATLSIVMGIVAALVVRDAFRGRNLFRSFLLFPYIAPVISVAFVWQVLMRQNGIVNDALGTNISFLSSSDRWFGLSIPFVMVILFQTWRYFPFAFLFLLARIQAIPDDLYEAAKVDGATPSQRLWFITLPQLRPVLGTLFLLRFIWTFNKFDDVYLLTGPIKQTKVIPVAIFEALFSASNVGQATAIAVIMAAILAIILTVYFKYFLVEEA